MDGFEFRYVGPVLEAKAFPSSIVGPTENAVTMLPDGKTLLVVARTDGDGGCVDPSIGRYHEYLHTTSTSAGASWSAPTLMPEAGSVRPRLLSLTGGGVLLSGGRQCWINKTDVLLWAHAGRGIGTAAPAAWQKHSLSSRHNALWRGDPALRFFADDINATYGGPHSHFLGTLSYTSLLPLSATSAVVTPPRDSDPQDLVLGGQEISTIVVGSIQEISTIVMGSRIKK
jgi:hypothetical protein